jgi:phosphate-selective porin
MVLGETPEGRIKYAAGFFRHDGRNSEMDDFAGEAALPGGDRTVAARAAVQPLSFLPVSTPIRELSIGAAFTRSNLATGLSSLPGVTSSNHIFFPRLYVQGTRLRRGVELSGKAGSLSFQGEFMHAREQRRGQGLRSEDLPDLQTQGWYLSAVHPLFGSDENGARRRFPESILPGPGLGRLEAAVRYEAIRFGSASPNGAPPSRSPRAVNVAGNEDRAWTLGLNWHASRYLKLQFNAVREVLEDPARTPIDGIDRYWTLASRLQLYF